MYWQFELNSGASTNTPASLALSHAHKTSNPLKKLLPLQLGVNFSYFLSLTKSMALEFHKSVLEEEDGFSNDSAITNSPPLCGNENGYVYKTTSYHHHPHPQEPQSLINFKPSNNILINSGESLLSFQQNHNLHQWGHQIISPRSSNSDPIRLIQDFNCIQTASTSKEKHQIESSYVGWLYSEEPNVPCDNNDNNSALQDSSPAKEAAATHKRLSMVLFLFSP